MQLSIRALATGVMLVAGCGATVNSSLAPGANVNQYKTFAFHSAVPEGQAISVADQDIDNALRQALVTKGYVEATDGKPDFVVMHQVKLQQQVSGGYGYGWYGGYYDHYTYTEGTLIVDFVDPKTNAAFWRGTAADVVNNPSSPNAGKIQAAVDKLIKQYPSNLAAVPSSTTHM